MVAILPKLPSVLVVINNSFSKRTVYTYVLVGSTAAPSVRISESHVRFLSFPPTVIETESKSMLGRMLLLVVCLFCHVRVDWWVEYRASNRFGVF